MGQRPDASLGAVSDVSQSGLLSGGIEEAGTADESGCKRLGRSPSRSRTLDLTMCGICGQFDFVDQEPICPDMIRRMATSITHRGPDDEGYYFSGSLGLGFRRLSIIDLGGGHQPMSDQTRSVWVVFNGEIYNFSELKRQLEDHGHVFQTKSDTEVIIHGYKQWGKDVLNHLNGMFGLAIWDEKARQLIVARD